MRKVKEWIGKTDDTAIPLRVKLRIFELYDGCCAICTKAIMLRPAYDHTVALCNGGENRESNLRLLCVSPCHSEKTRADVAEKAKVNRVRKKHLGISAPRQKIQSRGFAKAEPQRTASRPLERRS